MDMSALIDVHSLTKQHHRPSFTMDQLTALLQHLLLLMRPVHIVLLYSDQTSAALLQTVTHTIAALRLDVAVQLINFERPERTPPHLIAIDARHKRLFVTFGERQFFSAFPGDRILESLNIVDYYAHTHLYLVPSAKVSPTIAVRSMRTPSRAQRTNVLLAEPFGLVVMAIYDQQQSATFAVRTVTRGMHTWLPLRPFLDGWTNGSAFVGQWGAIALPYALRLRRRSPVKLHNLLFNDVVVVVAEANKSGERRRRFEDTVWSVGERDLVRLSTEFLETRSCKRCGSLANDRRSWNGWLHTSYAWNAIRVHELRWGVLRYALIVPNWWRLGTTAAAATAAKDRDDGHTISAARLSRRRQLQSVVVLAVSGALFVGLVLVRWLGRVPPQTRAWMLCDTWARLMAVSVSDGDAHGGQRSCGLLATVWGMLTGITMTGVLFELALGASWQPVFGELADVWRHPWLPVYFHHLSLWQCARDGGQLFGQTRLNNRRIRYIDWTNDGINRRIGAFLIADDFLWNIESLMGVRHVENGSSMYRIVRDPRMIVTHYIGTTPGFLRPRMQMLAHYNLECGLQTRSALAAQHRGRLNEAQANRLDVRSVRHLRTVAPIGLIVLGRLYAVLNGMAAIVCLAEMCWRKWN